MSTASLPSLDLLEVHRIVLDIAREAGELIVTCKRKGLSVEYKGGDANLVTNADRQAVDLITQRLRRLYPEHEFCGEEGTDADTMPSSRSSMHPVWYIDPIDGTTNFAHGLPWYAISIAFEMQDVLGVGVVLAPELGWEFTATRGHGARFNSEPMHVSQTKQLSSALLATGFPYDRSQFDNMEQVKIALHHSRCIRRMGVASLDCALVARGWFDGYWEYGIKPWDVAAGALLVQEAGGIVTDASGAPYRSRELGELPGCGIITSNGAIHAELINVLKTCY